METKREATIKRLSEVFSIFSNMVTIRNQAGYTDINKSSERLFIDILNIAYSLNLRDMNDIQDNYPAIDLGDYSARTCIQITSETTNAKFRKTVKKFKENSLSDDFDRLWFLIVSNKEKCSLTDDDLDTDVINLNDLAKAIFKLNDRDLFYIDEYLSSNLLSKVSVSDSILPSKILPSYCSGLM